MKRLVLAMGVLAASVSVAMAQEDESGGGVRDLSSAVEPILRTRNLPALGVVTVREGRIVAQGAVGVCRIGADEAVTDADLWHIGSCTKAMTATLAARLVEADRIGWDTTIGQTLAAIDGLGEAILPAWRNVTFRQLLSHRSGLPEDRQPDPAIWPAVRALGGPIIEQRREVARLVLSRPPASEPGTQMAYANFGYVVAAAMMEHATGRSWEDLMRAEVFEPLEMHSAGFGPPSAGDENRQSVTQPWGHLLRGDTLTSMPPWQRGSDNPPAHWPAGGIHLTLADWAKFAVAHVKGARGEGGEFLTVESWKTLHEDLYKQNYALGWGTGTRPWAGGEIFTHAGSNAMWMAVIWLAPQRDVAVMAATNAGIAGAAEGCDEAVAAALAAMDLLTPGR